MKQSKWSLRRRYGRSQKTTTIRTVGHTTRLDQYDTAHAGDRVEVGGDAANTDFLIAYRIQRLGESWKTMGPFANVAKIALRAAKRRSR